LREYTFMDAKTKLRTPAKNTSQESSGIILMDTSIDLDGNPCAEHLFADDKSLFVENGSFDKVRKFPFDRIDEFRVEPSVGSCFLQARRHGKWSDILRMPGNADLQLIALAERLTAGIMSRHVSRENDAEFNPNSNRPEVHTNADFPEDSTKSPSSQAKKYQSLRTGGLIFSLLRPFRASVALLLALSLGAVAIDVVPPMLQKMLVDHVLQLNPPKTLQGQLVFYLSAIVGGLLCVRVAATLVAIWKGVVASRVGTTMTANLRNDLVKKLNSLPLAFHDRNQVGVLMSQVAYDTETLHTLVYHMTSGFLLQSFQLVGIGAMLFYLNAKLAWITMLPMPFILLGSWYFTRHLQPRHQHYWEAVGKQASALMGMLSGIRVVKAFVQEDREISRFRESSFHLRDSRMTVDSSTTTFSALMGLIFALGTLAVWHIGGQDVMSGTMTLGSLMAFLAYLAVFYTPLTTIAESTAWFANFFSVSRRIGDLLAAPSEPEFAASAESRRDTLGTVEFKDVSFGYDKSRPVLRHINFAVAPGEMIGVVGRSGSGKSTLISLITRLYEADSGCILIDGIDAKTLNPRELRRKIGLVPQDPFLFRGTVAENIAYGNVSAAAEQIISSAKSADAHDFIMRLPFAYETQLGEGGSGLSGGERQRLSIARALLCDPDILLLDEATANVDAESEKAICQALRHGTKKRTTFIIAHRFSTLKDADRLLVFDNGGIKEQGTSQALLARGGLYAALARIQGNGNGNSHHAQSLSDLAETPDTDALVVDERQEPYLAALKNDTHPPLSVFGDAVNNGQQRPNNGEIRWLNPANFIVDADSQAMLRVETGKRSFHDVYAVRSFPGSHDHKFICLRRRNRSGREIELGMIQSLDAWPASAQRAVERSLGRRYLFHDVREVKQILPKNNLLSVSVATDGGTREFSLAKAGENCQPFGASGLLLTDSSGNYYVISDRRTLPKRQRRLLTLYFGV
jgi:ATP-binding cassette, subfamily B, bacterial